MEPVAVTSQKHDPAWKYCQMFKNGDRVQLKCIYCGKVFKGGGIHRIKEHLAGQKGNAATCLRVQPDVRLQMLESLNSVAAKKRKKQKLAEEMSAYDDPGTSGAEGANRHCGLSTENILLPATETTEHDEDAHTNGRDGVSGKIGIRKKKGRAFRKAREVANSSNNTAALMSSQVVSSKKVCSAVQVAIGRFFFDVGLSADAVKSAYFQPMIDAIASQETGALGPSHHDLRSWILKNVVREVRSDVDHCTETWGRTGCSVLVDEWSSVKGTTFVDFFVYSPQGTIFLRSADLSQALDSPEVLYDLMKEAVDEVGVRNVMQVITSVEDRYAIAGKRLMESCPTIFWIPCAAQCIELILNDIKELPPVKMILDQAKSISRCIYTNNFVLNMMRRYTYGVDLVDLGCNRSSTDFMTLKRMLSIRHNLQSMFTSEEWVDSPYSKNLGGYAALDYVSNQSFWSAIASITSLTDPLLRLLRIASSEKSPGMGYVYAALYRTKESIKKELITKKEYLTYWNIIDKRWGQLHQHPLHAAGFYLNPKFFYDLEGDGHLHIRSLFYDCMEKLIPDPNLQDKIMKETASYHGCIGDFGRNTALRARNTLCPTEWWSTYGGGCPNLARLATRILSQTCCLIKHKLNKIPAEHMHERQNCVEHQRLRDLVFVQNNMNLKQMAVGIKLQNNADPISFEHIDTVEEWITNDEFCSEGSGNADWMIVEPPLGNVMVLGPHTDDVEALGAGFDDYEIFGVKDSEEENGDENISSH